MLGINTASFSFLALVEVTRLETDFLVRESVLAVCKARTVNGFIRGALGFLPSLESTG